MFIHNLKYSLKTLFRNRMLIFWTYAFPIILGTLFNMAFSNIESKEKLDIIDIAVINNEAYQNNEIYKSTFEKLSKGEEKLFNIKYTNIKEAQEKLENKEISGYLLLEEEPKIIVKTNGINETILKQVVEEIEQQQILTENLIKKEVEQELKKGNNIDYNKITNKINETLKNNQVKIKNISNSNLSYTLIEFYTLIAMSCLYGGMLSMVSINQTLANMSNNGKRVSISPISKIKIITSSLLASYIAQIIGIALLFTYTIFILKINYGGSLPLIILLALVGCLSGLSLGTVISTLLKTNENMKTGILLSVTMLGCFLSGMMGITMKYVIDKNIPIINKINPASMITDGFYSLYYYDTLDRYKFNIISLLIFSAILITISIISLRRQKYDSI